MFTTILTFVELFAHQTVFLETYIRDIDFAKLTIGIAYIFNKISVAEF